MKTLQEIKDEYAKENGKYNWNDLFGYTTSQSNGSLSSAINIERHLDNVSIIFAKEVAKQALINVSEKAQDMQYYTDKQEQDILGFTHRIIQSCYAVPKQSILNESNIPEL